MIKVKDYTMILSSGREISVNKGILGINHKLDRIYDGYDGDINLFMTEWKDNDAVEVLQYTPEEITEICDYAIGLWRKMKEKYEVK